MKERIKVGLGAVLVVLAVLACKGSSTTGTTGSSTSAKSFVAGDEVDVEWSGEWWKATVISVEAGGTYKIHYVGWGSEWDESVGAARIRARTAGSKSK